MKILLVCSGGMSTALLVQKMQKESEKFNGNFDIKAIAISSFDEEVKKADVILLGPQIRYKLKALKQIADKYNKPIDVIDPVTYGRVEGAKALNQAIEVYQKFNSLNR